MNERETKIRATLAIQMERVIKRRRYDERQLMQILRATPDKAKALMSGQLDGFATSDIQRMLEALD